MAALAVAAPVAPRCWAVHPETTVPPSSNATVPVGALLDPAGAFTIAS